MQIVRSDLQLFGTKGFLVAGLPACLVSAMLSSWRRYWMSERVKQWLAGFRFPQILYV